MRTIDAVEAYLEGEEAGMKMQEVCEAGPTELREWSAEVARAISDRAERYFRGDTRDALAEIACEVLPESVVGQSPHIRGECGCFTTYHQRADLFKQGVLWLEKNRGEARAIEVLDGYHEELNRRWCEDDFDAFRDWWREVLRAA